jgi:FKBP-type peptidyl-prolyl cis-trans isomerase FkpA
MKNVTWLAAIVCTLSITACSKDAPPKPLEVTTDDQKAFYSLGVLMSQQIEAFTLSPEELALVQKGLADGVAKAKPVTDPEASKMKLQEIAQGRFKAAADKAAAAGVEYLDKASKEAGAVKTTTGIVIKTTKEGTGAKPTATDQVKVHYTGRLIDGKVFDSSVERGEPATFPLNGVIPCWTEGVQTMKVGGKAQLVCPSDLAYGPNGSPPSIPPQATLVFDVELLEIVKAPK